MASEKSGFACALEQVGEVHIKIKKKRKMNEDINVLFMFASHGKIFIESACIQMELNLPRTKCQSQMRVLSWMCAFPKNHGS
jgi:hypothetical protein